MAEITYDAIILGSSPNELVCAAYLAKGGHKVLVLEPGRHKGQMAGRSPWLQPVHAMLPPTLAGEIVPLRITAAHPNSLAAEPLPATDHLAPAAATALAASTQSVREAPNDGSLREAPLLHAASA